MSSFCSHSLQLLSYRWRYTIAANRLSLRIFRRICHESMTITLNSNVQQRRWTFWSQHRNEWNFNELSQGVWFIGFTLYCRTLFILSTGTTNVSTVHRFVRNVRAEFSFHRHSLNCEWAYCDEAAHHCFSSPFRSFCIRRHETPSPTDRNQVNEPTACGKSQRQRLRS